MHSPLRHWLPALPVVAAVLASAAVFEQLPATVPTHWDANGAANGWSSRGVGAFLLPGVMGGVWALMAVVPRIDPRGASFREFDGAYTTIIVAVLTFLLALHLGTLASALGWPVPMERLTPLGLGVLLVVIGAVLPRARPNYFIGIRTPWTLASDTVWARTHAIGGYLLTAAGVVIVLAALLLPPTAAFVVLMAAVVLASLGAVVYSYVLWRREGGA